MNNSDLTSILAEFQGDDIELAGPLLSLRQEPGRALEQRVQSIPRRNAAWSLAGWPRLVWASLALVIVGLLFVSPAANATWGEVGQAIGRIRVLVLDVLPRPISAGFVPTPTESPIIVASTPMSLAEAQASVPFDLVLPTYLPAGLRPDHEILVTPLETPIVTIRWRDIKGGFVQLTAYSYNSANNPIQTLVGPDSSETVLVNGQEAILVSGAWDQTSRSWRPDRRLMTLIWEVEDIQYRLLSFSDMVSSADLIAVAESVR
ncbi:MAG TPA: hypothetical protein VGD99_24880 [Anaerolineae bacterium]|jgi:hypothetical protein